MKKSGQIINALGYLYFAGVISNTPSLYSSDFLKGPRDEDTAKSNQVTFKIDQKYKFPISSNIYGTNIIGTFKKLDPKLGVSFYRQGGNRFSAYNWENNYSHAGSDYRYQNDRWLCSLYQSGCNSPGDVVKKFADSSFENGANILLTVPMLGYVAFAKSGGDVCRQKPNKKWQCPDDRHLKLLFRKSVAKKNKPLSLTPDLNDEYVYQDEFVNWVNHTFKKQKDMGKEIFFSLDNEPALWSSTHIRLRSKESHCKTNVTYEEILGLNIEYAKMIKSLTNSLVFGPVNYGFASIQNLQGIGWCTKHNKIPFYQYYLESLNRERIKNNGKHLVDVWDFHWYPEIRSEGKKGHRITRGNIEPKTVEARISAPRSLWDPSFDENTWITKNSLNGPLKLIPRIRGWIAKYNPGMKIGITEYNHGGEHHISGAIAQAETLGVFGREGVFAASFWSLADEKVGSKYIKSVFQLFRNYDDKGSKYGDIAISATTDGISKSAIFASQYSNDPNKLAIIMINKTNTDLKAKMNFPKHVTDGKFKKYQISEKYVLPEFLNEKEWLKSKQLILPPLSITLLVN